MGNYWLNKIAEEEKKTQEKIEKRWQVPTQEEDICLPVRTTNTWNYVTATCSGSCSAPSITVNSQRINNFITTTNTSYAVSCSFTCASTADMSFFYSYYTI